MHPVPDYRVIMKGSLGGGSTYSVVKFLHLFGLHTHLVSELEACPLPPIRKTSKYVCLIHLGERKTCWSVRSDSE